MPITRSNGSSASATGEAMRKAGILSEDFWLRHL